MPVLGGVRWRGGSLSLQRSSPVAARVLLVAPYAQQGGGIGRMMEYLTDYAAVHASESIQFECVESHGTGRALKSVWPTVKAAARIMNLGHRGERVILHVNMAERGSVLRKGILLLLGRHYGLPTVLHLHAAEIISTHRRMPMMFRVWMAQVFRAADVCIVLGALWQDWLERAIGVDPARIETLANAVPEPSVVPFPIAPPRRRLVFFGNLSPRKGVSDLIAALSDDALQEMDWELIVAGGGDSAAMHRQVVGAGLEARITLLGWLERAEIAAILAQATMLILPSYQEGMPLVLLEAASQSVPVIATRVGAIPDVFTDGQTALLIDAGDINGLTTAIRRLLDDPGLRREIARNARALFERRFSMARFYEDLLGIYLRHGCLPGGSQQAAPLPRASLPSALQSRGKNHLPILARGRLHYEIF